MKRSNALGRHFGMQDDDALVEEVPVEEVGEGVDGGTVEVNEAAAAVEAEDAAVQELVEAHENLEEVAADLEEAAAEGGLSEESAKWARRSIRLIVGRYPGYLPDSFMSQESFGSNSGRSRATVLSMESVREMVTDFWKLIWAKIQKMWAAVKDWYLKVLDSAPRLKRKAEALEKAADARNGSAEDKKVNVSSAKLLALGGKPAAATAVISGLAEITTLAKSILAGDTKVVEAGIQAVEAIDEKGESSKSDAFKSLIGSEGAEVKAGTHSLSDSRAVEGAKNAITPELLGGKAIITSLPEGDVKSKSVKDLVKATNVHVADFSDKAKEVTTDEMATLSLAEIGKVATSVVVICDEVIAYKRKWEGRDKQSKELDAAVKKAISTIEKNKEASAEAVRGVKDLANGAASLWRKQLTAETAFVNYAFGAARAALIYGERSLAKYKKA